MVAPDEGGTGDWKQARDTDQFVEKDHFNASIVERCGPDVDELEP